MTITKNFYRAITENTPDGVLVLDRHGKSLYQSQSFSQFLGYVKRYRTNNISLLLHPDDLSKATNGLNHLVEYPDDTLTIDLRLKDRSGTWRSVHVTARNLLHHSTVMGIVVHLHDLTNYLQTKAQSESSEEKWRALVTNSHQLICSLTSDGTIIWANRSYAGFQLEHILGACCYDLFPYSERRRIKVLVEHAFRFGEPHHCELRTSMSSHSNSWFYINVIPVKQLDTIKETILMISDITDQKQYEEQLAFSTQRLRQANSNLINSFIDFASRAMPAILQEIQNRSRRLQMYETRVVSSEENEHWKALESAIEECEFLVERMLRLTKSTSDTNTAPRKPDHGEAAFGKLTATSQPAGLERYVPQRLSKRETHVLRLLADDLDNTEIGRRLGIKESTVRTYLVRILEKLNLMSRREAITYAAHLKRRKVHEQSNHSPG